MPFVLDVVFAIVFFLVMMTFIGVFAVFGFGIFSHLRLFQRIVDQAHREFDKREGTTFDERSDLTACAHCGTNGMTGEKCSNCGATI